MLNNLHRLRRWMGVDRAVFFSNSTQIIRLITGPITMLLVLRYLTPEVQGYFYAFSGVLATQVFLEMGFSQNILQFASHEFAKLHFTPTQAVAGDPVAQSRLISLGRLAFGYYAVAALIVLLAIGVGGHIFFSVSKQHGVAWQGAWWMVATTTAAALAINPAWALLEGCNQMPRIAQFRFWASLISFGVNAGALWAGAGIFASPMAVLCNLLLSIGYLVFQWRHFFRQFLTPPQHGRVSWRREIWPFQWRIAVSWGAGYFIFDIINPVAFYFCGAVESGQLGMSLQLIRLVSNVAMNWIYTKVPRFGMLIANKAWQELDALWKRSTIQTFVFCFLGMSSFLAATVVLQPYLPEVMGRLAPPSVNVWLCGALLVQVLTNCMAMELRAHKREPYMWLAVGNALLSLVLILWLVQVWGIRGEAMGYALAIWLALIPAYRIYRVKRLEYRQMATMPLNE